MRIRKCVGTRLISFSAFLEKIKYNSREKISYIYANKFFKNNRKVKLEAFAALPGGKRWRIVARYSTFILPKMLETIKITSFL